MKLLLDENLSDRVVGWLRDLYPDSAHVKQYGLMRAAWAAVKAELLGPGDSMGRVIERKFGVG